MNPCLINLFDDDVASTKLAAKLPEAFEMAGLELPRGNPAVGFLREHAITGFFRNYFGSDKVIVPKTSNERGFNVTVCGRKLSIITVTKDGGVKVLWTADTNKAYQELKRYSPRCDILLTQIHWESYKESIFYIPIESQKDIFCALGRDEYLKSKIGTNHRGIEIKKSVIRKLQAHELTKKLSVDWRRKGLKYTPYDRWEIFWEKE